MNEDSILFETPKVRCLEYFKRLTEELYLTFCGIEHCLPGYLYHTEGRPAYHLHVVLEGRGVLSVNGRQHDMHFGQMFITKPGEEAWYQADENDPWVYCWMTFDGTMAHRYAEDAGFYPGVNVLECHVDPRQFYALVKRVLDFPEPSPANLMMRTGIMLEYISLAVHSNSKADDSVRRSRDYPMDDYVQYAVNFINENYPTAKIGDVARYIGIHRSYLTNIFKAKMGVSPQEYLMQCKLQHACKLLIETSLPIQEIARQVGYDNPLTFSKTFKTFYGLSPRNYRLKHKALPE